MKLSTRREIRNLIGEAEGALPRTDSPQLDKCRDLFAQACVSLYEGRAGRKRLVSCVRRLMTCHPTPGLIVPVATLLAGVLVCSIEPDEESAFELWERTRGQAASTKVSTEALDTYFHTLVELVEEDSAAVSAAEYAEAA